ncbi:MAG: L-aspartate oxidase [Leptolyngbya sp. SIO4C1]|nr:L-aspartate oxidase [Leptolyngbya sp. SIO4C1]
MVNAASLSGSPFDVLVIGGGAAGLYSALCLPTTLQVGLMTKDTLSLSASDWAQGGIAAAIAPDDRPELHITDTLKAGAGLCELDAVTQLVAEARDCIDALVDMGVAFDRKAGELAMTLEAAHSRRRVLHAADTTGRAVVTTLAAEVLARDNIQVFNQAFVLDLWLSAAGDCQGVCVAYANQIHWIAAKAVVLATGGGGQVYAQTTNPAASTGDGVAMTWRAGGQLRDLEFVQFHPTALTQPGAPHFLISEAVRGEGAHLIDAEGRRFAFDYHPDGELAPRDVVSRAIFLHLQQANQAKPVVWLDLRPIEPERIQHRFPNIIRKCKKWADIDLFTQPVPVSPAAHYWMGGITTDLESRTTLSRLYAVGENASTGVHGANRLASNSLLECLVFGAQLENLQPQPFTALPETVDAAIALPLSAINPAVQMTDLRAALSQLVWRTAGICREATGLKQAIATLEQYQQTFEAFPLTQALTQLSPGQAYALPAELNPLEVRQWGELRNLLAVGSLILKSALFRTESRGGHYRSDFPQTGPSWQVHTLIEGDRCWQSEPVENALERPPR